MSGTPSDTNPELDPATRETEAELRALLRPGGSTDRVWHLVEFSAAYEEKQESRLVARATEKRSREQLETIYGRSLWLVRLPQFRVAAVAAVVLMTMALTQPLSDTNVPMPHLSYTVPTGDEAANRALDQAQMTNLIMALSSDQSQEREAAEQSVVNFGPRILPMLTPLLKSNDPDLRSRAERLIRRVSENNYESGIKN